MLYNLRNSMTEKLKNNDVIKAINEGNISLSEVIEEVNRKLNETKIWEIQGSDLPFIEKMKTKTSESENLRFIQVDQFVKDVSEFLSDKFSETIQTKNWKRFLVLWDNNDNIYEIIEKRWKAVIAYNPITKMHIIYKYIWEKSQENDFELSGLDKVSKTHIDWYYEVTWTNSYWWLHFPWDKKIVKWRNYYYIWENWDTKHLWDYKDVWDLKQFWPAVYFTSKNSYNFKKIVINNVYKTIEIPYWWTLEKKSESWKYFLHIINNIWSQIQSEKHSLYDLDLWNCIFKGADIFEYENKWDDENNQIIWNHIIWAFRKKRKFLPWFRLEKKYEETFPWNS